MILTFEQFINEGFFSDAEESRKKRAQERENNSKIKVKNTSNIFRLLYTLCKSDYKFPFYITQLKYKHYLGYGTYGMDYKSIKDSSNLDYDWDLDKKIKFYINHPEHGDYINFFNDKDYFIFFGDKILKSRDPEPLDDGDISDYEELVNILSQNKKKEENGIYKIFVNDILENWDDISKKLFDEDDEYWYKKAKKEDIDDTDPDAEEED